MPKCFRCDICQDCGLLAEVLEDGDNMQKRLCETSPVIGGVEHIIHLHGSLQKKFGATFTLAVSSPAEAVKALALQVDGFVGAMSKGAYRLVKGHKDKGIHYGIEALHLPFGHKQQHFHIVPIIKGAKSGGVGKVLLGAVILGTGVIGASMATGGLVAGLEATVFGGASGITWGGVALFGGAMMLSGISMVLQPAVKPNYQNNESPDQRASFFLGGQVNQCEQGATIPVMYGRVRVGSIVASAGLTVEKL